MLTINENKIAELMSHFLWLEKRIRKILLNLNSQDLFHNSSYCLPYNLMVLVWRNVVLDQLIFP